MIGRKNTTLFLVLIAMLGFCVASASASLVSDYSKAYAYDDGGSHGPWWGTTAFQHSTNPNFKGYVEWIVFAPGDFPFSGYTPTSGQLTYAYQVYNTGTVSISQYKVGLLNTANNQDSFSDDSFIDPNYDVTGLSPISDALTVPGSVLWNFSGLTTNSEGLVYSSPNKPQDFTSWVTDGGQFTVDRPVPSPSSTPIPEPNTLLLLVIGLGMAMTGIWLRRR